MNTGYHMSCERCHMLRVNCHMSLTPTATATVLVPPPANSPTMHSRMICKDHQLRVFFVSIFLFAGRFWTILELKLLNLRPLSGHTFPKEFFFVIDNLDIHKIYAISHNSVAVVSRTLQLVD